MSSHSKRKSDHIELFSKDEAIERAARHFDRIKLIHRAIPELSLKNVDTSCRFLGKKLSFPFLISSMTGSGEEALIKMNKNLALAAEQAQVGMGVGSQRIMLVDKRARESFGIRQYAPTVPLIANIGAVQLNYGLQFEQIDVIIDILKADAIYLHFNPLQEAIQPEGDTNFECLAEKIQKLVEYLDIPVIAKEVGSGFSNADLLILKQAGIRWVDVAGHGGTSWSRLENHRRQSEGIDDNLGIVFQDWGISTPDTLKLVAQHKEFNVLSSGGLRNGIDMIKSLILGADVCALAAPLLESAKKGASQTAEKIQHLQEQFTLAMFLLGCSDVSQLKGNHALIQK